MARTMIAVDSVSQNGPEHRAAITQLNVEPPEGAGQTIGGEPLADVPEGDPAALGPGQVSAEVDPLLRHGHESA